MIGVSVAQPDVTLVLDNDGVINEATLANSISDEGTGGWIGRPWFETVGEVGSDRVRRMIEDARATGLSAFGQVDQRFPSGRELPIEYTTARLAGRSGLVAVGKNLQAVSELQSQLSAAQQAREQEYWKLREVETRYRLLFDASNEAVLIVRADSLRIAELNIAATRALGVAQGSDILSHVAPGDQDKLRAMLGRVRESGRAPGIIVRVGTTRSTWSVRASLLTIEPGSSFLLQFAPVRARSAAANAGPAASPLIGLIDRLPDSFVVLDSNGFVRSANRAFLDLTQTAVEASVVGKRLSQWLAVPGADAALLASVQRNQVVRVFPTKLEGELGTAVEVEITAVGDRDAAPAHYGVIMRDVSRRASMEPPRGSTANTALGAALGMVSDGLGSASMPDMVRDTVEAVERHCIVDALGRVRGNRSAAAELLGISRQSLYAKLGRYGLDGGTDEGG